MLKRLPWQQELEIVDRTMKAISGITDPEEFINAYWNGIGELMPVTDYVSMSRRDVEPPFFLITRSSRFTEYFNPWTQRDRLPKLSGGLLGELAFANRPVVIDDVPSRLKKDDPGYEYLVGSQRAVALPQYDRGEGLNVTVMLLTKDVEPDPAMIPMLHWQSGLFGRGTHNLVLRNQLSKALSALDRELQVVGDIQRSLLPSTLPAIEGFEVATFYQTSARAGGDYYDFFPLSDGSWGMFIADVSGHGTPAAVLMAITHAIAHAQPGTHTPPSALLEYLNDRLTRAYTRAGTFVTAFYGVLDPKTRVLTYSNAGHNPPRLLREGRIKSIDCRGGLPLGIFEQQPYTEGTFKLDVGDLLLLYTDGITEASPAIRPAEGRKLFGVERLDEVLQSCASTSPQDCLMRVREQVGIFCEGAPPVDDQTLIAVRCTRDV